MRVLVNFIYRGEREKERGRAKPRINSVHVRQEAKADFNLELNGIQVK